MNQREELSRALAQASAEQSRAEALHAQLRDLDAQIEALTARETELARQRDKEQADVDALEGHGLAALFYAAIGRREEKLDKEKAEAYEAAAHYDAVKMQRENAQRERDSRQAELDRLGDPQARYTAAYQAKLDWLRQNDPANGAEIARLESEKLACEDRRREIAEALAAGEHALDLAKDIRETLNSASSWATFDIFGGDLVADLVKHGKLENAQKKIYDLQNALSGLRTELADVDNIDAGLTVTIDSSTSFADYFFDTLFDLVVLERINRSIDEMDHVCERIRSVIWALRGLDAQEAQKRDEYQSALDRLVTTE